MTTGSNNKAKRLSGINTLAYMGIEPITAPLLIVKLNNELPTTDDRVGNQIGAVWVAMDTAALANNARIFVLTRLDGSGSSGTATWTELETGGTGAGVDFFTTDDGNTAIPVAGNINFFGGTTVGGVATNLNTFTTPDLSENMFVGLNNSIFFPNTTDINNGVIGFGGNTDLDRFIHNFGAANTFVGDISGNFTLTGTNLVGIGDGALVSTTSGSENTAVGSGAGSSLTTGGFNTLVGSLAGAAFDTASNVVAVGARAAQLTTGSDLVVIGATAAQLATTVSNSVIIGSNAVGTGAATGSDNVIIGQQAAENITSGSDNVVIGSQSGSALTTGNRNELIGRLSGFSITSGFDNVAIGYNAAASLTTGTHSVYIGTQAGGSVTTSSDNIAIGYNAAVNATTLASNVIIGTNAVGTGVATGSDNVIVGQGAGVNITTASNSVVIGSNALASETTTSDTVAIGFNAGATQNGGTLNTFIGTRAGEDLTTATTTTLIGYQAGANITTGLANTSVGTSTLFNATTQEANTAVGGSVLFNHNGGTGQNTAVGFGSLFTVTSGSFNTAVGWSTGVDAPTGLTTGNLNVLLGHWAGNSFTSDETSNVIINSIGVVSDDNTLRIGQATGTGDRELNRAFICGIRGITTANADAVTVLVDSANQLGTVSSSARYKDNIEDMQDHSNNVMDLRPVVFTYKNDEQKRMQYGLIAEEVEKVMPRLVVYDEDGLPQSVRYNDLPAILLNEIQKLEHRIYKLENTHCATCTK